MRHKSIFWMVSIISGASVLGGFIGGLVVWGVLVKGWFATPYAFAKFSQKTESRQSGALHKGKSEGKGAKTWKEPPNDYIDGYLVASTAEGEFLKLSGGQWVNATAGALTEISFSFAYGDHLYYSDDEEEILDSTTWTKMKEYILPYGGNLRIKFDLKNENDAFEVYGRIYKNDVAVGTQQTATSEAWVTFSEDISGWAAGDKVQLWIASSSGYWVGCRNLRIYSNVERLNLCIKGGTLYWAHK